MSSQQSRCPFCGAPVEGAVENSAPVAPVAPIAPVQTTVNEQSAAPQRTLNDILAERQAQAQKTTINDTHAVEPKAEVVAESKPEAEPKATPVAAPTPTPAPQPIYDRDYDREERMIDDYEADITRYKRSSAGFLTLAAILLILLIPLTIFAVKNYGKVKAIEQDYALLESARSLFEEQNNMLQRDAESLVKELEEYKGKNPVVVGVLKGVVIFNSEMIRAMDIPCQMDFMCVSATGAPSPPAAPWSARTCPAILRAATC
jgi:hypothetical protein